MSLRFDEDGLKALQANVKRGLGKARVLVPSGDVAADDYTFIGKPKRNKYGVDTSDAGKAKRTRDGILFASQREAKRYDELKLLQAGGDVDYFLRQVPFHLPGGVKYVCDFMVVRHGCKYTQTPCQVITYEDVKGAITKMYALKVKQVKAIYGIDVVEV